MFNRELSELQRWLGIAIEFEPPRRFTGFEHCQKRSGMSGVVGGLVVSTTIRTIGQLHGMTRAIVQWYGMTCGTVLFPRMQRTSRYRVISLFLEGSTGRGPDRDQPLSRLPVFLVPGGDAVDCTPATDLQLEGWWLDKTSMVKDHQRARRRRGLQL